MTAGNSAADPYAGLYSLRVSENCLTVYLGIFFSKDRRETVIEAEEDPEIVQATDYHEPLKVRTQGRWMKGCPEGRFVAHSVLVLIGIR